MFRSENCASAAVVASAVVASKVASTLSFILSSPLV
jgi:hypothetical protein